MASSLTEGIRLRSSRMAKISKVLKGDKTQYIAGSTLQVDGGTTLLLTPIANPGTCTKGNLNVGTDGKLYVCSATNTWTVVGTQA